MFPEKDAPYTIDVPVKSHHSQFQPYADNGGNAVGIAGDDYVVAACDTRIIEGYNILSRNESKAFKLTSKSFIYNGGCWCDVLTLRRVLETQVKTYSYDHNREINVQALAQLVAISLYNRRFFPYFVRTMLCGLDEKGRGRIYRYDPVGCLEEISYGAEGSSIEMTQPFLDNQVAKLNQEGVDKAAKLSVDEAVKIVKDALISAAERDTQAGDGIHVTIITKDGIRDEIIPLRKD